jgi:soluble lytic murein transglycosylase-like protein
MEAILAILVDNMHPKAVQAENLAAAIYWESMQAGVDPELVARIVVVESSGRERAVNYGTADFGLMQINKRTAQAYSVSQQCLMNWKCNLKAGIKILADMQRISPDRPCMYNLGPKGRFKKYKNKCSKYEQKLESI